MTEAEFREFVIRAHEAGFISDVVCLVHDGLPMTEEEDEEFTDGADPCIYGVRLYEEAL